MQRQTTTALLLASNPRCTCETATALKRQRIVSTSFARISRTMASMAENAAESVSASASGSPPPILAPFSPDAVRVVPPSLSFFKRALPDTCIAFDSQQGKALFKQALAEGNMENYFNLAQHFTTQEEVAYCGLATLCLVLNSLGIDPQQQYKGPWRYYSQEMLE